MLTVSMLRDFGANVDEGLNRCMNSDSFYLRLVTLAIKDDAYARLEDSLKSNDFKTAFDAAHSLKGLLGNLALTPLYAPAVELTELLRNPTGGEDYATPLSELMVKHAEIEAMIDK